MKKITFSLLATFALVAIQANAEILFQCPTTNGKQIQLLDQGNTLQYSFGKVGKPEIVVKVPRNQAQYNPWRGIGSWENYSVSIPNGNTSYEVFHGFNHNSDEHEIEAGVTVNLPNGDYKQIFCTPSANIINGLEDVTGIPTEN